MNWFYQMIILQAVLTIIPCLIIVAIFRVSDKNNRTTTHEKED